MSDRTLSFDSLRPFLSRIIALLVAGGVAWLRTHYRVDIDDATQHQVVDLLVESLVEFTATYAVSHRLIDKKFNPSDAAGKHLAAEGRRESTRIKTAERHAERDAVGG